MVEASVFQRPGRILLCERHRGGPGGRFYGDSLPGFSAGRESLKRRFRRRYCKNSEGEKLFRRISGANRRREGFGGDPGHPERRRIPRLRIYHQSQRGQPEYGRAGRTFRGAGDEGKTHPGCTDAGAEPPGIPQRSHPLFRPGGIFLSDWSGDSGFGLCGFVQ